MNSALSNTFGQTSFSDESATSLLGSPAYLANEPENKALALARPKKARSKFISQNTDLLSTGRYRWEHNPAPTGSIMWLFKNLLPSTSTPRPEVLQEWEGYVVELGEKEFFAHLTDLTAGDSHPTKEVKIPFTEISSYDRSRIVVGSIFCWVIGYEQSAEGTKTRISRIAFRDLPRMARSDFQKGEEWADQVLKSWET